MVFQEEVTAEESTDGEVEAQTYNQDSQDSIGEVSIFEKKKKNHSFSKKTFFFIVVIQHFRGLSDPSECQ